MVGTQKWTQGTRVSVLVTYLEVNCLISKVYYSDNYNFHDVETAMALKLGLDERWPIPNGLKFIKWQPLCLT